MNVWNTWNNFDRFGLRQLKTESDSLRNVCSEFRVFGHLDVSVGDRLSNHFTVARLGVAGPILHEGSATLFVYTSENGQNTCQFCGFNVPVGSPEPPAAFPKLNPQRRKLLEEISKSRSMRAASREEDSVDQKKCPTHRLVGKQAFSIEEVRFLLDKAAAPYLCELCRQFFHRLILADGIAHEGSEVI